MFFCSFPLFFALMSPADDFLITWSQRNTSLKFPVRFSLFPIVQCRAGAGADSVCRVIFMRLGPARTLGCLQLKFWSTSETSRLFEKGEGLWMISHGETWKAVESHSNCEYESRPSQKQMTGLLWENVLRMNNEKETIQESIVFSEGMAVVLCLAVR